jgi:hypothetical protein
MSGRTLRASLLLAAATALLAGCPSPEADPEVAPARPMPADTPQVADTPRVFPTPPPPTGPVPGADPGTPPPEGAPGT